MMEGGVLTAFLLGAAGVCAVLSGVVIVLMWTLEVSDRRRSAVCRLLLIGLYEESGPATEARIAAFVRRNASWLIKPGVLELRRSLSLLEAKGCVLRVYGTVKRENETGFFEDATAEISTYGRWRAREIMVGEDPKAFREIRL